MDKYLIAVDLDGTLLPSLYSLSSYSVKVFNKLREEGHKIVITTGRPFRSSYFVYRAFNLDTPLINYNGGLISNPSDSSFEVKCDLLNRQDLIDIYLTQKDNFYLFFAEYFDSIYSNRDYDEIHELMHYSEMAELKVGEIDQILDHDAHGSLILAREGYGEKIKKYVLDNFKNIGARIWSWGPYKEIVELYSQRVSKGTAIKYVREGMGFDKAHLMACGDSHNDFEFFDEAGIKVTLSNGDIEIRKKADIVYPVECKDDGLAKFMVEYFHLDI